MAWLTEMLRLRMSDSRKDKIVLRLHVGAHAYLTAGFWTSCLLCSAERFGTMALFSRQASEPHMLRDPWRAAAYQAPAWLGLLPSPPLSSSDSSFSLHTQSLSAQQSFSCWSSLLEVSDCGQDSKDDIQWNRLMQSVLSWHFFFDLLYVCVIRLSPTCPTSSPVRGCCRESTPLLRTRYCLHNRHLCIKTETDLKHLFMCHIKSI